MTKEEFNNKPSTAEELTSEEKDEKLSDEVNEKPSTAEQLTKEEKDEKLSEAVEENYKFGWSSYSEITNGRFAMIGFLAIILIELFSQQSFLKWAGILYLIIKSRTVISWFLLVCSNVISTILIF